jgi:hypothetical protein
MGTDTLGSQSKKDKKDRSKGETKNTVLGKKGSPATDTATAFQNDQQYPVTAEDPVVKEYEERRRKQA